MPSIKVNDISMYYEIHGSGDPLVLIAGLGTDHTLFKLCISKLSQNYKVLIFDNRGVGNTDKPDVPYTIEMMADDTATLMAQVDFERAHVLGVSLGGRIAMELALMSPEKVRSLLLVSTSSFMKVKLSFFPKFIKRVRSHLSKKEQPYYAFTHQLSASRNYDCSSRLHDITVPTLIMSGKKDGLVTNEQTEAMNVAIKGSKLIMFDGGHIFFLLENKRFTECLIEFLRGID